MLEEQIFINDKQRFGGRFNGDLCYNDKLITNPNIDYIFDIDNECYLNQLHPKRQIPFIDASHNLQLDTEDKNCLRIPLGKTTYSGL